jgi:selenocysteine lyase/cysteine desulfurase
MCWKHYARRYGVMIDIVQIPPGENDARRIVDRFAAAITRDTRLISVSHVLSSTGLRMPIAELAALARAHGCLCIVDGAQAVGAIDVNVKSLGCHAYATSGHKWLLGPKGTGLLYLSDETAKSIDPLVLEDGRGVYVESVGVRNIPGVIGLGAAMDYLTSIGLPIVEARTVALRNRLHAGLQQIPRLSVVSPPPGPLAAPVVTCSLPGAIESGAFVTMLREKHQFVVKMVPKTWLNGIRVSTHIFNTDEEVDRLLHVRDGALF